MKQLLQDPHGWMIDGTSRVLRGEYAEMDAKAEAKRCGGTCTAYPVYTQPVAELTYDEIEEIALRIESEIWRSPVRSVAPSEVRNVFARAILAAQKAKP